MANPAPCQGCLEVADAEFYVTNRLGVPWPFKQSTVALCVPCFIQTGIQVGEALQAAMAEIAKMAEPGVLEQVEADEGEVRPARSPTKSRRSRTAALVKAAEQAQAPQEAQAPDDRG